MPKTIFIVLIAYIHIYSSGFGQAPIANFTFLPTNSCAPVIVQFTSSSTGNPTRWFWDFGDGTTSVSEKVSHAFRNPGNYWVMLAVSNNNGGDTIIRVLTVNSCPSDSTSISAGNIGIGTTTPSPSAILDIASESKGLLLPRMTDSQRIAINAPATGLIVYQVNGTPGFYFNIGTPAAAKWVLLAKENMPPIITVSDTTFNLNTPTDTLQLTGSATDKDGTITAYFWSQVSGPNTPMIFTPGASSTQVSGLVNGTYVFQLMALDNNGATAVKSMSLTVKVRQPTTIILQPGNNPNDVHLAVNSNGNASDKTAPEFGATAWTYNGSPAITRGIFKFDLNSIPAGATILSAKLTLYSNPTPLNGNQVYPNAGSNNTLLLQRVTSNWTNSITWYNQPFTDDSSQIVIPHTNQSLLDLNNIDVTKMVKAMLPNTNYGFLIKLENEAAYNSRIFCSSKYSDATKHPKLEIEYVK